VLHRKGGGREGVSVSARTFPPSLGSIVECPSGLGNNCGLPIDPGGSPARGKHAENFPENQRKFPTQGTETDEARVVLEYSQQACEARMSFPIVWELIGRQGVPPDQGGAQNIPPDPRSFLQPRGRVQSILPGLSNIPQPRGGLKSTLPGPSNLPQPRGASRVFSQVRGIFPSPGGGHSNDGA